MGQEPWPTELRLLEGGRTLNVAFDDGAQFALSAELLRTQSPSAEVQGHSERERKTVGGKRNVAIIGVAPVGNYAVRLDFDDMHRTGIYTWRYLRELGETATQRFDAYVEELAAKGLDRDRPGEK
ncbi:gamma-butyrobetaine hydroxylase-like domain-containing protein [Methylocystis sp.]|uniref:gamma-butyrobetaine hydroxylase-like domain-containing protein n=1 Tax=Methylocystis sp. TaxID=1911079 RepID=UPI003D0B8FC8